MRPARMTVCSFALLAVFASAWPCSGQGPVTAAKSVEVRSESAKAKIQVEMATKALMEEGMRQRMAFEPDYNKASAKAVAEGKALVVLIGVECKPAMKSTGTVFTCAPPDWHGVKSGIVVSKDGFWLKTLPPEVSVEELGKAISSAEATKVNQAPPLSQPQSSVVPMQYRALRPLVLQFRSDCPTCNKSS